jgi:predicted acetyltransferase
MQVRTIDADELAAWVEAIHVPVFNHPAADEVEFRRPYTDFDRAWAAVDGDGIVDAADQVKGVLRYHVDMVWDQRLPKSTLAIDELLSVTPAAYAALWRYCCELDLVTSITADERRVDEPLPWLVSDARAVRQTGRADFLWVRILDVPRTLSARGYLSEGRCVLEVVDALGYAAGRFVLVAGPQGATCHRTHESAALSLGVAALGAAYLGGTSVSALHEVGLIDEHTPGAVDRLDALLRTRRPPWSNTWF